MYNEIIHDKQMKSVAIPLCIMYLSTITGLSSCFKKKEVLYFLPALLKGADQVGVNTSVFCHLY